MEEIKCPNCGEVFQVDESGYQQIAQQIRDIEFKKELLRRESELQTKYETEQALKTSEQQQQYNIRINEKDKKIAELENAVKQAELLQNQAVMKAVADKESELLKKESQIVALTGNLQNKENEKLLEIKSLQDKHLIELKLKDEQIEQLRDFKAKQSTKMVGESLEQHCEMQFNSIRMTAFPNAYFEKDNDASSGSKGDFIYKETTPDGTEFISIMFEMKNEMETTATKHKNEHFFKELDKDRNEKKCEYAVLVSLLENDNEYYNTGIVDVSYKYPKMYVIRPQFFIPIITILRNAALNSVEFRKELNLIKNQQIDLLNFEDNMNTFKEGFARNYELASRKFQDAIDDIDKTIKSLEKTKADLISSDRNLRLANDKAQDLSIKKLTKNAPSIKAQFDDLKNK